MSVFVCQGGWVSVVVDKGECGCVFYVWGSLNVCVCLCDHVSVCMCAKVGCVSVGFGVYVCDCLGKFVGMCEDICGCV